MGEYNDENREMDLRIAKKIFGDAKLIKPYSYDLACSHEVVEHLLKKKIYLNLRSIVMYGKPKWMAQFQDDIGQTLTSEYAETVPMAICMAALDLQL